MLSLDEMNAQISRLLGRVPLKAYEDHGRIYLSDGVNNPADVDDRTPAAVAQLLYEWAVFTGETNDTFEDFLKMGEEYREYNADCPFCEVENTLIAKVSTIYGLVPLHNDGYEVSEGRIDGNELVEVTCSECGADVGSLHYFHHGAESGEECDCKNEGEA